MKLSCVAILQYDDDGICVFVPDLPMCNTCGYSYNEALQMAKEVIELGLHGMCADDLPHFRGKEEFELLPNQQSVDVIIDIENRDGFLFSPYVVSL